jgi:hypothetical protein
VNVILVLLPLRRRTRRRSSALLLRNRNIDLSPVVAVSPQLGEPPQITRDISLPSPCGSNSNFCFNPSTVNGGYWVGLLMSRLRRQRRSLKPHLHRRRRRKTSDRI